MTYSYEDLCAWRKEANVEMKKYKAKMEKTKGFIGRVDKTQKGLGFFGKIAESGALQNLIERIRK
ncbi:MAG: hypothetical protein IKU36_01805 [Bacteroidales bacterium]|nr:hypothetical protein [Bacteroidales bacterium]